MYRLVDTPIIEGDLMYYYSEKESDTEVISKFLVLDDKSIPGDTLAKRRLNMLANGVNLAKLDLAIFFLGDLIKVANTKLTFIDSNGKLFKYNKNQRAKLKFYPIYNILPIQGGGGIVIVKGLLTRFKVLFMPERSKRYAGVLHLGLGHILYGLYEEEHDETWRMV